MILTHPLFGVFSHLLLIAAVFLLVTLFPLFTRQRDVAAMGRIAAICLSVGFYFVPEPTSMRFDRIIGVVGLGKWNHVLLVIGMMLVFIMTRRIEERWSPRDLIVLVPAATMIAFFIATWVLVKGIHTAHPITLYYGLKTGHPWPVFLMNVARGAGIAYVCLLNAVEYARTALRPRSRFQRLMLAILSLSMLDAVLSGFLTIAQAVVNNLGLGDQLIYASRTPFSVSVMVIAAVALFVMAYVQPPWYVRRQSREVNDLSDLMQFMIFDSDHRDNLHLNQFVDRGVVEDIYRQGLDDGVAPYWRGVAEELARLMTAHRDNIVHNPDIIPASWPEDLSYLEPPKNTQLWRYMVYRTTFLADVGRAAAQISSTQNSDQPLQDDDEPDHRNIAQLVKRTLTAHRYATCPLPELSEMQPSRRVPRRSRTTRLTVGRYILSLRIDATKADTNRSAYDSRDEEIAYRL